MQAPAELRDSTFAQVAHELRTPVTGVLGYLELLLEPETIDLGEEGRYSLETIEQCGEHLLRTVRNLLYISGAQPEMAARGSRRIDLETLLVASVDRARTDAGAQGIRLSMDSEPVDPLRGDVARLGLMFDNLLANAVRYNSRGGRVVVRLRDSAGLATTEVEDNGLGIDPDERRAVLEPFVRGSAAHRLVIPGSGLGLTVARSIAEAHGGSLALDAARAAGTTVRVELPAG